MTSDQDTSQAEAAYQRLRGLVRDGTYDPGDVLSENALAAELGMSRTPVREAVSRLTHEGLLVRLPRRGVVITTLSVEDVRDLYSVREALEAMCARTAAVSMPEDEVRGLRDQLDQADRLVAEGISWREYRKVDRQFHATLWAAGRNKRAESLLDASHDAAILDPWFHKIADMSGQSARSVREHTAIVEAIEAHDPQAAAAAASEHAQSYQRALAEWLFGDADGARR
ncbi:MAG TPA: GntR family transcriptional regulator [Cellulomonas sp.]